MEQVFYIKFEMKGIATEPLAVNECQDPLKVTREGVFSLSDEFPKTIDKGSDVTLEFGLRGKFLTDKKLTKEQEIILYNKIIGYLMFHGRENINENINSNEALKSALSKALGFPVDFVVKDIDVTTKTLFTSKHNHMLYLLNQSNIKCNTTEAGVSVQ